MLKYRGAIVGSEEALEHLGFEKIDEGIYQRSGEPTRIDVKKNGSPYPVLEISSTELHRVRNWIKVIAHETKLLM